MGHMSQRFEYSRTPLVLWILEMIETGNKDKIGIIEFATARSRKHMNKLERDAIRWHYITGIDLLNIVIPGEKQDNIWQRDFGNYSVTFRDNCKYTAKRLALEAIEK